MKKILVTAMLVMVVGSCALAEDGRGLLERAVEHYSGLEAYAGTMEISLVMPAGMEAMAEGMPPSTYGVTVAADGRVAYRPQGGMIADPFVQDSEHWFVEIGFLEMTVMADAVSVDDLLGEGDFGLPIPGFKEALMPGRRAGQVGSLLDAGEVIDGGSEDVGGTKCRRLDLAEGPSVWVAAEGTPWILRMRSEATEAEPGTMMIQPGADLVFTDLTADPDLDGAFEITPTEGFELRDSMPGPEDFAEAAGGGPGGEHPSVGSAAPDFELPTLDGGMARLSDLKGSVVVLDFWATWCKPCLMALPGVIEVTSELADQGVVFWAVNQRESEGSINKLLTEKGWTMPVALDADGAVGSAYGVQGIPHTAIIDKAGVVRHVHSGFAPGMDEQLKKEIEALLAE